MSGSIPIFLVDEAQIKNQHAESQSWLNATGFRADPGSFCLVPDGQGGVAKVLVGQPKPVDTWSLGNLPPQLPPQQYHLAGDWSAEQATRLCLGWQLGQYRFSQYKRAAAKPTAQLQLPSQADQLYVAAALRPHFWCAI